MGVASWRLEASCQYCSSALLALSGSVRSRSSCTRLPCCVGTLPQDPLDVGFEPAGTTPMHKELEQLVAEFLGKEDSITFGMGFATNAASIPALAGPGTLVLSDALNHTSIVAGGQPALQPAWAVVRGISVVLEPAPVVGSLPWLPACLRLAQLCTI